MLRHWGATTRSNACSFLHPPPLLFESLPRACLPPLCVVACSNCANPPSTPPSLLSLSSFFFSFALSFSLSPSLPLLSVPFGSPTVLLQQRTASSRRYTYTSLTFALSSLPWPHPHNRRVIIKAARYTWTPFAPFHNTFPDTSGKTTPLTAFLWCRAISRECKRGHNLRRKCRRKSGDGIFRRLDYHRSPTRFRQLSSGRVAVKCDSMYRLKVAPRRYATLMASRANSFRGE